jgi:hypothetical protein
VIKIKKICTICGVEKEISEFYSQNKVGKSGEYVYYHPTCKRCEIIKAKKWNQKHPDVLNESVKKHYSKNPEYREKHYQLLLNREKDSEYMRKWRQNNKDKIKEYNAKRKKKNHNINQHDWDMCLEFFNNSCAYCGMTDHEAVEIYGKTLNKEHVIWNGKSDITNCVPSCTSCNSRKHKKTIEEFLIYDRNNGFTSDKLEKIYEWLEFIKGVTE